MRSYQVRYDLTGELEVDLKDGFEGNLESAGGDILTTSA